ncbi:hypothetical protein [Ensifer soli]|uniref:hypothetical protein n=1 Tax=Ciceribacter sp. sgz301302 TaxID=3342379 RepID=UPI0035B98F59
MSITYLLWLGCATLAYIAGATTSRAYIANQNLLVLIGSLGLYTVGNLIMLRLMREGGLGLSISLSAVVQLVLINIVALVVFGERLSAVQTTGVVLGILAMGLMLMPGGGRA